MIRASSTLLWFSLAILTSVGLYRTSDHVQELNRQLNTINSQIEAEQQSIHVLKAEWVYLANPSRLASMTKKHLALNLTSPRQITTMENLASLLPMRNETTVASAASVAAPVAPKPMRVAAVEPQPRPAMPIIKASFVKPVYPKPAFKLASADTSHLMDHMMIQRSGTMPTGHDQIGTMLAQLEVEQ